MPPLLTLSDIHLTFGGTPLLEGAEIAIGPRERLSLIGRNGSGKSTLLKIAAGLVEADRGERVVQQGVSVAYLPQEPDLSAYPNVLAYVESAFAEHDDPHRARTLLNHLGLSGEENPKSLSGGEARRAALARVLAPAPDVLLLDEPTNHLDLPAIEWLEEELKRSRSALVLISHDRRFLTNLGTATVWLDRGRTRRLDQGFAAFEDWRDEVLAQEELERHKLDRKIAAEEHWIRHGVSGRRKRNVRRVAALADLRQERREGRRVAGTVEMTATDAAISSKLLMEAKGISKSFGERTVVRDVTMTVLRGDRIGIVGPNGAGKTTLLKLLTGELAPDTGTLKLGASLEIVTLDQRREALDVNGTLMQNLTRGHGDHVMVAGKPRHVVGYMKDFLFTPEQANTPVAVLSGGERGRLMLARALSLPSNVLVLDEPTNDLDLETLDLLQEMLADYAGTVLLVSHDRDFLDRVATNVVAFEGDGRWQLYPGGYADMVNQRGYGVQALSQPTRPAAKAEKPASDDLAPERQQKRKLTFKQKHALETLPARMEQLRKDIAAANKKLADPALYSRDPKGFAAASETLHTAEADLAAAENEWLELEILREEIANA
ncbi:MAG: ATP-binding cassette domain-containing protein [Rhodospirillaceae bacterium]|nr:ATP-binding cassette domain-containing protein [Rhodospirillaceae bacterium]